MESDCFVCGEKELEDLKEEELGNPAPEEVQHYECANCGAYYTVVLNG